MSGNGGAPDMVNLTVDGIEVAVPAGTPVIQAAERAGIVVPHYCYHPGIPTRPAQCRMCLVEIEGQPKLQPSCVMAVQEGMIVRTQMASETVQDAQQAVIEFLLINHPLDCPICDAAGQCMLQDYAFETGQLESRYDEHKLVLGRDRVADDILYFADRCIICTRCVRFMDDVAGENSLIVAQRGHKAYIDTFPGKDLDHPFRGNIVDVCPVGALVHEDFVFKARAWDMDAAPGICGGCSQGCNIDVNAKENQVVRVKPRYNPDVNGYWMCDEGRRHMVMTNRGQRVDAPLVRIDGRLSAVTWAEALEFLAERLSAGMGGTAVASATESNESLFAFRALLDYCGVDGGGFSVPRGPEAGLAGFPRLRLRAERVPNGTGASELGFSEHEAPPAPTTGEALFVLGDRLADADPDYGSDAGFFLYLGSHLSAAARNATVILPIAGAGEADGTFVNHEGRVQRFHRALTPPGVARPAWMVLHRLVARLGEREPDVRDVRDAFAALVSGAPAFEGLTWQDLGLKGQPLAAAAPAGSAS